MKAGRNKLLSIAAILAIHFGFGNSILEIVPRDTVAVAGRLAYFNCSTSNNASQNIQWHHYDDHVYAGGKVLGSYEKRFTVEMIDSTRSCNLVILNVTKGDAGRYRCTDNEGFGEKRWAELIVMDTEPICTSYMKSDGIVGPNSCNVDQEDVSLSCSVTYNGNVVPKLNWTRIGESSADNTVSPVCKNSTNRVECNLTIKADLHPDGSSYVCHVNTTSDINCTSDPINKIYAHNDFRITKKSINDELRCKPNSNQRCSYRWIWSGLNGSSSIVSDQSNVTADRSGIYRCQSECNIRGKQCSVSAMFVYIPRDNKNETVLEPSPSEAKSSEDSIRTPLVIVVVILILLLVGCIIILLYCYRNGLKEKQKTRKVGKEGEPLKPTTQQDKPSNQADKQEIERLNIDLQATKDKNEELGKREIEWSTKEAELKKQLSDREEQIKSEKNKNEDLKKHIDDREKKEAKLNREKADLESKVNASKARLEEVENRERNLEKKIKRLTERKNEIGRSLYLPPKEPSNYKAELHRTILTQAVQEGKRLGVCGVAILDEELFVITDKHPNIEVYDLSNYELSRNIQLNSVTDPGDITACQKNKWIYIVDWTERNRENMMLRLGADGKENINRLSLADDECRLSLTKDANILVTFYRRRKIIEYTPEWREVFQTEIKSIRPIHAVKLSSGLLAICHAKDNETTHEVCIMDDDGSLLKSFGGLKGAGMGQVNFPTYLAVDKNDSLLVADRKNGRVLLLNSRLELTVELLSKKNEIRFPRALSLDETNSRLFVADCDDKCFNGQVLSFNLK